MCPSTSDSRPKKYLRLSVRTLLAVVLIIALVLAGPVRNAQNQRNAVKAIRMAGGLAHAAQSSNKLVRLFERKNRRITKWLRQHGGGDYFDTVFLINFPFAHQSSPNFNEKTAPVVGYFKDLVNLTLPPSLTDTGLQHFKDLTKLEKLDLSRTQITSAGLANLRNLTQLTELNLSGTRITDAGLYHLEPLNKLCYLGLDRTDITDAAMPHLARIRSLQALSLNGTKITDAGLIHLQSLENLTTLSLTGTKVTGAFAANLKPLVNLLALNLEGTAVNDTDVQALKTLRNGTEITSLFPANMILIAWSETNTNGEWHGRLRTENRTDDEAAV